VCPTFEHRTRDKVAPNSRSAGPGAGRQRLITANIIYVYPYILLLALIDSLKRHR
jgi:hypothetical protein